MKAKALIGSVRMTLVKYSPEILLGVGIVGTIGATVMACKATTRIGDALDEREEQMAAVEKARELKEAGDEVCSKLTEKDFKNDILLINAATAGRLIKLYGPSVSLYIASIACILGSYRIMNKRNVALMAAYKVLEESFSKYRRRVVSELGSAKDAHFMYGTETVTEETTVIDEDGKKKKVKKEKEKLVPGADLSGFARSFEQAKPDNKGSWTGSTQWSPIHEYNLTMLKISQDHFNDKLIAKGFITVNEVLEHLGFPTTEAGMICGWRYKDTNGDGYISFQPRGIDGNWAFGKDGDSIILDFNIDGVIFDEATARSENK